MMSWVDLQEEQQFDVLRAAEADGLRIYQELGSMVFVEKRP